MSLTLLIIGIKLPAIFIGLWLYRHLSIAYRLVLLQVVLAVITELWGYLIVVLYSSHNIWLFNVFNFLELNIMMLAAFFLLKGFSARLYIIPALLATLLLWITGIYKVGLMQFYTPSVLAQFSILVLIYLVVLYNAVFQRKGRLRNQPQFWLGLSIVLFFGGNLPFYGFFNYMNENHPDILEQLFHPIIWTLNIVRYPMVAVSLYLASRQHLLK